MIIILLMDDPDEDLLLLPLPGVIYQPSMTGSRMSFIIKNGSLSTKRYQLWLTRRIYYCHLYFAILLNTNDNIGTWQYCHYCYL
jgi:hypothetical protein